MTSLLEIRKQMPSNWDDHEGWNNYYSAYHHAGAHTDKDNANFDLFAALYLLRSINTKHGKKIWFPGCGASVAPHLFAALGFEVWASDVSELAIQIQEELRAIPLLEYVSNDQIRDLISSHEQDGVLNFCVHDFRESFTQDSFDWILNIKSFQAFPVRTMKKVAQVHYDVLKPNGRAFFSTMNVQGEQRDTIEESLVEAGFLVPFHKTERWYRGVLAETDIPHVFIIGSPMVLRQDDRYQGSGGSQRAKEDQEKLQSFKEEYQRRLEQEREETQAMLNKVDSIKVANVIYNTG